MKVVLITKAFPAANALFNRLDAVVPVTSVVVEGPAPRPRLGRRARLGRGLERVRARLEDPLAEARHLEREAFRAIFSELVELERRPPVFDVPHRGWDRAIAHLEAVGPDLVVVFGTSLVPERLASLAKLATINIHTGLAPYYRGVHATEMAVINDDLDNVGVTVHLVVPKIDGGAILGQARPKISAIDDEFSLELKVQLLGHRLVEELLVGLVGGARLDPVPQTGDGLLITREAFTPEHRRLVRRLIQGGAIDRYLARRARGKSREKRIVDGVRLAPG